MDAIKAKFERNNSLDLQNLSTDEQAKIQVKKKLSLENINKSEDTEQQADSANDKVPEIKDIYDYIYGNVQSKLEFYEGKRDSINVEYMLKHSESIDEDSNDSSLDNLRKTASEASESPKQSFCETEASDLLTTSLPDEKLPDKQVEETSLASVESHSLELHTNSDLPKGCESPCTKCQKADIINDRTDVLTDINTNLKVELENVKRELKSEIAKNNELNFEIANIESALETYYKDAKNQKSTLASIYFTMKNYTSNQKSDFQESYTYKRIKTIADYMETLKRKLEHQDRIIKNNFVENPYYMDTMIKHEAALKQLDDISQENQELKEDIKKKSAEELEIIKELNRQKFQIENKCKEIEYYYKNEIASKDASIRATEEEHKQQLDDLQALMKQKEEEMTKMQRVLEARINNYKQELVIVYRKWKEQRKINKQNI